MRRTAGVLAGIVLLVVLLAACGDDASSSQATTVTEPALSMAKQSGVGDDPVTLAPQDRQDLATLRRVTAAFHDFAAARRGGYDVEITGCMTDPVAGGMGFHFGSKKLGLGDGSAPRADQPNLLLYEPEKNGKMRLVAVEYTVPLNLWQRPNPPRLFGQDFKQNDAFGIWALHAWVWEDNPAGMFEDWNPRVNCDNTTDVMAMVQ